MQLSRPKQFNSPSLVSLQTVQRNDDPDGRYYTLPDSTKKLYSVTTVLSKTSDKSGLVEWRKRVGEVEANRISKEATTVGTKLHSLMEHLVLNQWDQIHPNPDLVFRFQKVKSFLETEIEELLGSELSVFSTKLGIAGTTDLVYKDKQQRIIVADLKTSGTVKKREYIKDYFLQLTAYAICIFEQFSVECNEGLIIMSLPDGSFVKFAIDPTDYIDELYQRVAQFHSMMNALE